MIIEASSRTALRQGDWAMIPPHDDPEVNKMVHIELGNSKDYQLYNLKKNLGQQNNLAYEIPEKLNGMVAVYEAIRGETPRMLINCFWSKRETKLRFYAPHFRTNAQKPHQD